MNEREKKRTNLGYEIFMNIKHQSILGLIYTILGVFIIIAAAGELLLRIICALAGLFLVSHGLQLWQGKSLTFFLWSLRNKW